MNLIMEQEIIVYLMVVCRHITVHGHTQMFNSCKHLNKILDHRDQMWTSNHRSPKPAMLQP